MERGVIVGGVLVAASFLLAVMFNRSAVEQTAALAPPASLQRPDPDVSRLTPASVAQLDRPELDAIHAAATLIDGREQWLLFPARVGCGPSLVDPAHDAIVIDYNVSKSLPGYRAIPDALTGRDGLRLREALRELRSGLYLGRAYSGDPRLLDFVLYDAATRDAHVDQGDQVWTAAGCSEGPRRDRSGHPPAR